MPWPGNWSRPFLRPASRERSDSSAVWPRWWPWKNRRNRDGSEPPGFLGQFLAGRGGVAPPGRRRETGRRPMSQPGCDLGLIGLGVMGRNFVLNLADHGFAVAVYNRTAQKTREFMATEVGPRDIRAGYSLQEFAGLLKKPRAIIMLVSAGQPVDAVIREVMPFLEAGDLLIDSGNSHFTDTN